MEWAAARRATTFMHPTAEHRAWEAAAAAAVLAGGPHASTCPAAPPLPPFLQASVFNHGSLELGWDWEQYDRDYKPEWAMAGHRRCWDEVAVLSRLKPHERPFDFFAGLLQSEGLLRWGCQ